MTKLKRVKRKPTGNDTHRIDRRSSTADVTREDAVVASTSTAGDTQHEQRVTELADADAAVAVARHAFEAAVVALTAAEAAQAMAADRVNRPAVAAVAAAAEIVNAADVIPASTTNNDTNQNISSPTAVQLDETYVLGDASVLVRRRTPASSSVASLSSSTLPV
jgi:hypothetical protein